MHSNVGIIDRFVRVVVGIVLIVYASPIWFAPSGRNWIGWIGVIPIVTGLSGVCPLYSLVGLSTCPLRRAG